MEEYLVALAHYPKITYHRYLQLTKFFGDPAKAWQAGWEDIIKTGWEAEIAEDFFAWKDSNPIDLILSNLEREEITAITIHDNRYPEWLAQIADPPFALFVRGTLPPKDVPCLSVVGTRRCTAYGKLMTEKIAGELSGQGVCIVSGLALGIDGVAHSSALEQKKLTVAVLGSGINRTTVYPHAHQRLGEQIIAQGGALISEYPPNFEPTRYSFPARNRIIAGLSQGTLITEAPEQSGALITARFALDYNREVMAVPHPATSVLGAGCNNLIKMGAILVTKASDVAETLNLATMTKTNNQQLPLNLDADETKILKIISESSKHIDEITAETGLSSSQVNAKLTMMEIGGQVKNMGGMTYFKC